MNLAALPRLTAAEYAAKFDDGPEMPPVCNISVRLTDAQVSSPHWPATQAAIEAAAPCWRFVGAFVISDFEPDPTAPDAAVVAFTFVKD